MQDDAMDSSSADSPIDRILYATFKVQGIEETTKTWIYKGQEASVKIHDLLTASCQVDNV